MLSTLVDNSTLTAVQRLIGDVPVALSFAIEGDVAAYDHYLQSLLLYDELAAVDDYKEEYSVERRGRFKEIVFLNPNNVDYSDATQRSIKMVEDIEYKIKRGTLGVDPMGEFLKALDLHVIPAWYMQSSNWFLNLRILADESEVNARKYGALMNSIQAQLSQSDRSISEKKSGFEIETRDSIVLDNTKKGDGAIAADVEQFAMGLNWIAQHTAFYIYLSERLDSSFTLHPIRHTFAGQYILNNLMPKLSKDVRRGALSFFAQGSEKIRYQSDEIILSSGLGIKLPFFAAWAVGCAGNPRDGYEHVLQIRYSREALALRSRFREIEDLGTRSDDKLMRQAAAKLRLAIVDDLNQLRAKFTGVGKPVPTDVSIDLLTLSPSISLGGLLKKAGRVLPTKSNRSTTILRSISNDFMMIPSFGDISDRFSSSRKIRKGTDFVPDRTRIEASRWKNASSYWKRPV